MIVKKAKEKKIVIPCFTLSYIPMIEPTIEACVDTNSFALIGISRIEWKKFGCKSTRIFAQEYFKREKKDFVRLHLDHIPVIDEDGIKVKYMFLIKNAINLGYHSIMIDG